MNSSQQYTRLLEPGKIGTMTLRNRMFMPAMYSAYGSEEGYVTQQMKDYYEARGRGGYGMVITEFNNVNLAGGRGPGHQLIVDNDRFLPGMTELASVIKRGGTRAIIQICHSGRGFPLNEISEADITVLVARHVQAAVRGKKAGFDGVELHSCHGDLLALFFSAASNQRKDRYGGSVENRARILVEILEAARRQLGKDYPIIFRVWGAEVGVKEGITIDQTVQLAKMLEAAGADAINVSTLWAGGVLPYAEAVKKSVKIPVMAVSQINLSSGEAALRDGMADFIGFGRPVIAEPELASKVTSGKADEIRSCLYCGNCSDTQNVWGGMRCSVNPFLGREGEYSLTKAPRSKKVIIVGGGPAGMEAALIATLRGHKVQLYEKGQQLGGQLLEAKVPPEKQHIGEFLSYLTKQMDKQDIKVHLGTEATADLIIKEAPDAVVLATGVLPFVPDIPGINGKNVVHASDVLLGKVQVGNRVAIIGGELVGCEVADFLTEAGKKVTVMRRGAGLATKMSAWYRGRFLPRFTAKANLTALTEIQYREIKPDGVVITDKNSKEQTVEADTVVLAAGARPNNSLLSALKGKVAELYSIGDCVTPRKIVDATNEGCRVGLLL